MCPHTTAITNTDESDVWGSSEKQKFVMKNVCRGETIDKAYKAGFLEGKDYCRKMAIQVYMCVLIMLVLHALKRSTTTSIIPLLYVCM